VSKNLLIKGHIYGYCYYKPSEAKKTQKFNIVFATYTNKQWYLIGFYLNCEFVENSPVESIILRQKMFDLQQLGNGLGIEWRRLREEKIVQKLADEAQWLNWRVTPDNAVRTQVPIAIPKKVFNTGNYRIVKPTEIDEKTFGLLYSLAMEDTADDDYGIDVEFPEGREIERKHKMRERNPALVKAAKDLFKKKEGRLYCQSCGFDFYNLYGEIGIDFIEVHHVVPVHELKGETKTKVEDVALVCSNCHRMLHRRRPWIKMEELKLLIRKST
jgi:hypothetical protein